MSSPRVSDLRSECNARDPRRTTTHNPRLLGPCLQLRNTHCSCYGYEERSRDVSAYYLFLCTKLYWPILLSCDNGMLTCLALSISGKMTAALTLYSGTFMRYSMAVTPKNYLLFACHFVNFGAQLTQGYRYIQYWQ